LKMYEKRSGRTTADRDSAAGGRFDGSDFCVSAQVACLVGCSGPDEYRGLGVANGLPPRQVSAISRDAPRRVVHRNPFWLHSLPVPLDLPPTTYYSPLSSDDPPSVSLPPSNVFRLTSSFSLSTQYAESQVLRLSL
jgi:hypothetical protein